MMILNTVAMTSQESINSDGSLGCIGPNDVLLGRGGAANNHIGNRMFRAVVLQHQLEYLQSRKLDKVNVARKIVAIIQAEGGRFLKRTETDDAWEEAPLKKAQEKTSQALREGLDVRHAQLRSPKSTGGSVSSSESSQTKTRKPYTIKQPLTSGKVRTLDTVCPKVMTSSHIMSGQTFDMRSVEGLTALALASLLGIKSS
jgi:hypothetical protein